MLTLNLSQWNDLTAVDHERLHDLLARRKLGEGTAVGLEMARQLARDAGAWTVVLGDFTRAGDSLHLVARVYDVATGNRVDVAQVDGAPGEDVRPLFDQLAAKLLNLSGAPTGTSRRTVARHDLVGRSVPLLSPGNRASEPMEPGGCRSRFEPGHEDRFHLRARRTTSSHLPEAGPQDKGIRWGSRRSTGPLNIPTGCRSGTGP